MPTNPLRVQLLTDKGFNLDRYAQSKGFPNAAAMESVLKAGGDLQSGGRISAERVAEVLKSYHPSMHAAVRETAKRCNAIAASHGGHNAVTALVLAVTGDASPGTAEAARHLISEMQSAEITDGILSRREAADKPAHTVTGGARATVQKKPEDPNSVRANLLRAFAVKDDRPRTEILADALERTAQRKENLEKAPEFHSLRDHITVAFDDALVNSEAGMIEDADALQDGFGGEAQR